MDQTLHGIFGDGGRMLKHDRRKRQIDRVSFLHGRVVGIIGASPSKLVFAPLAQSRLETRSAFEILDQPQAVWTDL